MHPLTCELGLLITLDGAPRGVGSPIRFGTETHNVKPLPPNRPAPARVLLIGDARGPADPCNDALLELAERLPEARAAVEVGRAVKHQHAFGPSASAHARCGFR